MIRAILACDKEYGIGKNGSLPWPRHKDDMRFFKMATVGHGNNFVVMGRKTAESLGVRFPLSERRNLVISTDKSVGDFRSFEEFETWLKTPVEYPVDDIYIIGGATIYNQALERGIPEEIYVTVFDGTHECDTFIDESVLVKNYYVKDERRIENYTFQVRRRR